MSEYLPKLKNLWGNTKVELDLWNYATKANLKKANGVDTSDHAKKYDIVSWNLDVDELDVGKLKSVPVNLDKLRNIESNNFVKINVYSKLVTGVNAIDTSIFALKAQYNTYKSGLEKKRWCQWEIR